MISRKTATFSIRFLILFTFIFFSDCREGKDTAMVLISGDELAVGAEIFADGVYIGTMEKQVQTWTSKYATAGDIFASANVQAPFGEHEFLFISVDQKTIREKIRVRFENYWDIDFYEMKIYHDE